MPKFFTMSERASPSPPACCLCACSQPWPTAWPRRRASTAWRTSASAWRCWPLEPWCSVSSSAQTAATSTGLISSLNTFHKVSAFRPVVGGLVTFLLLTEKRVFVQSPRCGAGAYRLGHVGVHSYATHSKQNLSGGREVSSLCCEPYASISAFVLAPTSQHCSVRLLLSLTRVSGGVFFCQESFVLQHASAIFEWVFCVIIILFYGTFAFEFADMSGATMAVLARGGALGPAGREHKVEVLGGPGPHQSENML